MDSEEGKMKSKFSKLFIDVGVGKPSSEAWDREKEFTIIGIEPDTSVYDDIKDVYPGKLLNVAASDKEGEIDCWEDSKTMLGIRVFLHKGKMKNYPLKEEYFKKVKKKTIKLDSLPWRGFDEIHIWADVEGAELLVLKGAAEMLSSGKVRWINLEIRKSAPVEGWATAKQVYEFLDKYGFKPRVLLTQLHETKHRDVIFMPKEI